MDRFFRCFDNPGALLALLVMLLMAMGTVMMYSASGARAGTESARVQAQAESRAEEDFRVHHSTSYLQRQVMWAALGLVAAAAAFRFPLERLENLALPVLLFSLVLLVLVVASPLGVEAKGAKRWLAVGPFTIQPSEFAKIGMVVYMAKYLADRREEMQSFLRGFLPSVAVLGVFSVLIVLEKDLGTIVVMGVVVAGMWCMAQVRVWHLASLLALAIPAIVFLIFQHSYRLHRILAILDPEKYATTYGLQLNQSLIAVGSGGLFGTGLGQSIQKYHFLPEAHTDFIYAIVCEELGLMGGLSVAILFLGFVFLGFAIAYRAQDYFSSLLAAGLTLIIGCAAFINIFVVLGLAPTKGLPLPFFSYGGSSLIASLICVGLLMNIANDSLAQRGSKEEF